MFSHFLNPITKKAVFFLQLFPNKSNCLIPICFVFCCQVDPHPLLISLLPSFFSQPLPPLPHTSTKMSDSMEEVSSIDLKKEGALLMDNTDEATERLKQHGNDELYSHVKKSMEFFEKVQLQGQKKGRGDRGIDLYRIEARNIKKLSLIANDRASEWKVANRYTLDSFFEGIHRMTGKGEWGMVADRCKEIYKTRCEIAPFLLGPLSVHREVKVKERKEREKEKKTGPAVTPGQVQWEKEADESETVKRVGEVQQLLQKNRRINFFDFVVDPQSFTQTVENIFHFSFLIKEGVAALRKDDNEQMVAEMREKPKTDQRSGAQAVRRQAVISLDEDAWRNIIKVRNLGQKRGVIPHRDYSSLVREQQQFSQKVAQEDDDLDDDDDEEGGEQGGGRWGEDDEEDDEEVDLMGKAGKAEAKEEGRKRKRADDSGRNVRRKY